jgi:hypothetical protein
MFVVFDLDGTLASIEHRRHHLDRKDWKAFFAACVDDVQSAVDSVRHLHGAAWIL